MMPLGSRLHGRQRPRARDDRRPPGAGPLQHRQPSRQRARRDRVPRRVPRTGGPEDGAARRRRRPPQSRRGSRRHRRRGAHALLPRPRRHRPRRPLEWKHDPVVRRRRRRLPLGPRRARHEVPGGRGGGRRRDPRPRRLETAERLPQARVRLRRGDRRRRRGPMAHQCAPGPHTLRHAPQRRCRRRIRVGRWPTLRGVLRGEGDLPLQADRAWCRRPRVATQSRRERPPQTGARPSADRGRQADVRADRGSHRAARRARRRPE